MTQSSRHTPCAVPLSHGKNGTRSVPTTSNLANFLRAGHWPTLLCAFLYFDVSFMVWVLLGALANSIAPEFGLTSSERGFLVAVPILGGALLRPVLGLLTDRIGARRTALSGLVLTVVPLALGFFWANTFSTMLVVGLLLGIAGASFAAALPLASLWYPAEYQGLVMGIAGAGNSGTVLAAFFAPRLAESLGWHAVFGLALIPVLLTLLVFVCVAKESPNRPPAKRWLDYALVLRQPDTWWFCLFYSVTFGGFVGLASFLNLFFHDQYGLSGVQAGNFAAICLLAGSFLRPVGGYLADRFSGSRILTVLYLALGVLMASLFLLPSMAVGTSLLFLSMALLGLGNGAVFQLVPERFPEDIGVVSGIVGAAGGLGGFFLPVVLGAVQQLTGSFSAGFLLFAFVGLGCAAGVRYVSSLWERAPMSEGDPQLAMATAEIA